MLIFWGYRSLDLLVVFWRFVVLMSLWFSPFFGKVLEMGLLKIRHSSVDKFRGIK